MLKMLGCAVFVVAALTTSVVAPPAAEAKDCGGVAIGPPYKRGKVSQAGCATFGNPNFKRTYSWVVKGPKEGKACMEGIGLQEVMGPHPTKKTPKPVERWFSLGCGTRGGGSVPWGNYATYGKVRAESLMVPLAVTVEWD